MILADCACNGVTTDRTEALMISIAGCQVKDNADASAELSNRFKPATAASLCDGITADRLDALIISIAGCQVGANADASRELSNEFERAPSPTLSGLMSWFEASRACSLGLSSCWFTAQG